MNIHASLPVIAALAEEIRAILGEGCDDLTLWDTISGETNVEDLVGALIHERAEAKAHESASRDAANDFAARAKRLGERCDAINLMLGRILDAVGAEKIKHPLGTVSRLAPKLGVEITDPLAVPTQLCTHTPDKTAIRKLLDAGETVPGAALTLGKPGVSVRCR